MISNAITGVLRGSRVLLFGVALSICTFALPASAQSYHVLVNGVHLALAQAAFEKGGRVFVPLRAVFEGLNAGVAYDNGTVNATARDKTVQVKIGSNQGIVDGRQQYLDAAPFLIGSTTMVPLRFVSEALGAAVNYDSKSGAISIAQAKLPIPGGAVINTTLGTELNTGSAYIGQPITLTVQQQSQGSESALAGATIYGKVVQAQAASQGTNPAIQIAVDSISLAGNADPQPLAAKVLKIDPTSGSMIAKEAGGALAGMLIGNWIGKKYGSNVGGLLGAAGGYLLTANSKANLRVPAGTPVTLQLTDALVLK
jgi:hypothetical protein